MEKEFSVRNVVEKEDNLGISLSVINLKGINKFVVNLDTTACYFCVKGVATFIVDDSKGLRSITLREGESIKIPSSTHYVDFSKDGATLIAINKPPFDLERVVELSMTDEVGHLITARNLLT